MRGAVLMAVSILSMAAAGCTAGAREGDGEQQARASARRDFPASGFQSVSLTGHSDVNVTVGGQFAVRAEGDREMVERLELTVVDGDLRIGFKEGSNFRSFFGRDRNVTVHVTMPALTGANLTGSGDINIDRVQGERFAGNLTGSGDINVGEVRVREAAFNLTGSGAIQAAGAAERAAVQLGGSGDISLSRLQTRDLTVSLMGSGDVAAHATGSAAVSLMGPGDVTITGPARCRIDQRGPGEVRCNA
jgi:hypothetical protein